MVIAIISLSQGCFRPGQCPDPDIECEDCGLVSYCSWGCRARDQAGLHRLECGAWRGAGERPVRDEVRVMIRAVMKLRESEQGDDIVMGGGEGDEVPGRQERRRFEHLLSHKTDFLKNKQKTEDIKLLYEETEEFLRDEMPSFDTFIEILGRLYINGFEICDSDMQTYGWGVYLGVR